MLEELRWSLSALSTSLPFGLSQLQQKASLKELERALHCLGIDKISAEKWHKLVGISTDGASANIAGSVLKDLVEIHMP